MGDPTRLLQLETQAAKILREQLADMVGDDEEVIRDTIEGETSLHELILGVVETIAADKAHIDGIAEHTKTMAARTDRLKRRIEVRTAALLNAMEVGDLKRLHLSIATISRRAVPPKAIIVDEAEIHSQFWKPSAPKLDMKAVLDALKDGQDVSGAQLSNGSETISIRFG